MPAKKKKGKKAAKGKSSEPSALDKSEMEASEIAANIAALAIDDSNSNAGKSAMG